MKKLSRILTVILFSALGLAGISNVAKNANGWMILHGEEEILTLTDEDNNFIKSSVQELYGKLLGSGKTYKDFATDLSEAKSTKDIAQNNGGTEVKVRVGGKIFLATYVTKNKFAEPILTLWDYESEDMEQYNNWYSLKSNTWDYPSNMYGTSKVRAYLVGSSYAYSEKENELQDTDKEGIQLQSGASIQSNQWKNFVENYGSYIDTPAQATYQAKEDSKTQLALNRNYPNDSYEKPDNFSAFEGYDYFDKENYDSWKDDKLWLPSWVETGISLTERGLISGLWELTIDQQHDANLEDASIWIRNGTSLESCYTYTGILCKLKEDQTNVITQNGTEQNVVRPAFHLNLKKVNQAIEAIPLTVGSSILKEGMNQLYNALGIDSSLSSVADKDSDALRSGNEGNNIYVKMGKQIFTATYLTKNNEEQPILTLWLAQSEDRDVFNAYYNNSKDNTWQYPSNMYGTSLIRSFLVGSTYVTTQGGTWTPESEDQLLFQSVRQNEKWRQFIDNFGAYIDEPSKVSYQSQENAASLFAEKYTYSFPSDSYSEDVVNFSSNQNYVSKEHYFDWKDDKIWLPSVCEVGNTSGIWKLDREQKFVPTGSWLRSGSQSQPGQAMIINESNEEIFYGVPHSYFIRPAFHLNLQLTTAEAKTVIAKPNASSNVESTYPSGEQKATIIDYNSDTMEYKIYKDGVEETDKSNYVDESTNITFKVAANSDAGTYEFCIKPKADYVWYDGTEEEIVVSTITISKGEIDVDTEKFTGEASYNKSRKELTITHYYDSDTEHHEGGEHPRILEKNWFKTKDGKEVQSIQYSLSNDPYDWQESIDAVKEVGMTKYYVKIEAENHEQLIIEVTYKVAEDQGIISFNSSARPYDGNGINEERLWNAIKSVEGLHYKETATEDMPLEEAKTLLRNVIELYLIDDEGHEVTEEKVGTYHIALRYKENNQEGTEHQHYGITLQDNTYTISKATNTFLTEYNRDNYTYGSEPSTERKAEVLFGEPVITYYKDSECTQEIRKEDIKDVGTYYVKVTVNETVNYDGLERVYSFNITKATNVFTKEYSRGNYTYGSEPSTEEEAEALFGEPVITYYKDSECTQEIRKEDIKDAGTYYVKVTIPGTDNYGGLEKVYTFTINKATNAFRSEYSRSDYTYGSEPSEERKVETLFGDPMITYYKDSECTQEIRKEDIKDVGTYYVKVTVDETNNYDGLERVYTFKIVNNENVFEVGPFIGIIGGEILIAAGLGIFIIVRRKKNV